MEDRDIKEKIIQAIELGINQGYEIRIEETNKMGIVLETANNINKIINITVPNGYLKFATQEWDKIEKKKNISPTKDTGEKKNLEIYLDGQVKRQDRMDDEAARIASLRYKKNKGEISNIAEKSNRYSTRELINNQRPNRKTKKDLRNKPKRTKGKRFLAALLIATGIGLGYTAAKVPEYKEEAREELLMATKEELSEKLEVPITEIKIMDYSSYTSSSSYTTDYIVYAGNKTYEYRKDISSSGDEKERIDTIGDEALKETIGNISNNSILGAIKAKVRAKKIRDGEIEFKGISSDNLKSYPTKDIEDLER